MTGKTITRADLVEALARRANLQRADANRLLTRMLEMVRGRAGRRRYRKSCRASAISTCAKRQRIGRNPKTGEEVPITRAGWSRSGPARCCAIMSKKASAAARKLKRAARGAPERSILKMVGARGSEPPTPVPQTGARSNRAAPRSEP